jgi:pimeloyl-ACP methyl ester carboxylesterase
MVKDGRSSTSRGRRQSSANPVLAGLQRSERLVHDPVRGTGKPRLHRARARSHPRDPEAVELPTGVVVRRTLPDNPIARANPASYRLMLKIINTRIADVAFVLRKLRWLNSHVVGRTIDVGRVGVFGHSLGGLTAAAIASSRPGLRAAADLDGSIHGPGARAVTRRPFMIMTEHGDGTMARYWARLRPPRLFVRIDRTRHLNFSDWTVLAPRLQGAHPRPPVGSIAPQRALTIIRTYLVAFFKRYAAGEAAPLLEQPVPYPEVKIKR